MHPTATSPTRHTGPHPVPTLLAVTAALPATAVATWWAIGNLSHPQGWIDPAAAGPQLSAATERTAGLLSLLVLLLIGVVINRPGSLLRRDRRWWAVLLPVTAAGALLAVAQRVATAATVGANLGIAFIALPCVLLAAAALVWSLLRARRLLKEHRRRARPQEH
ncbi:hypothetical protein [Kineococcus esterisolvens]|uniref:hypothetical protein n=2 Tax=unclassified Kineococcus TaxID=2621656 RepID=UPI003D7D4402